MNNLSPFVLLLLVLLGAMSLVMAMTWRFAKKWNNYGVVDAVWAGSFFLVAVLCFFGAPGWGVRKALLLLTVALWSLRLAFYLGKRTLSHHPVEDERYRALRGDYGNHAALRFFLFFQYQGLSVVLLATPFIEISLNPSPRLSLWEMCGFVLVLLSVMGEALADAQMEKFKSDPTNKQKTCDVGLWKYSRHPNYFFESAVWWGFFIMALGTDGAFYTIYAPFVILMLLLKVTGVPPSEAQALKKRGEEYRLYQERTSMFIPWFPKTLQSSSQKDSF